ncbi:MAG: hypothetical protein AAFR59_15895, partial [Bacteroidota bacterium]
MPLRTNNFSANPSGRTPWLCSIPFDRWKSARTHIGWVWWGLCFISWSLSGYAQTDGAGSESSFPKIESHAALDTFFRENRRDPLALEHTVEMAQLLSYPQMEAKASLEVGRRAFVNKRYGRALNYGYCAVDLFQGLGDQAYLGHCYHLIAQTYKHQNQMLSSVDFFLKAEQAFFSAEEYAYLVGLLSDFSIIFGEYANHRRAKELLMRALDYCEDPQLQDDLLLARSSFFIYQNLGYHHCIQGESD